MKIALDTNRYTDLCRGTREVVRTLEEAEAVFLPFVVLAELRANFRPEFLNRVDEVVLFKALQLHEIKQIVDLLVKDLRRRLDDRKITLELTEPARELIAREGFDPVFGARPLRRYIQRDVETRIARALIAGDAPDGSNVIADVRDGRLDVRIEPPGTQGDTGA